MFGDPSVAAKGKLLYVPAGTPAAVSRIMPFLTGVIAQDVIDLSGEELGQASLLKITGNVLIMLTVEMVAEVSVFAEKSGLGKSRAKQLMEKFPFAKAVGIYAGRMHSGTYIDGQVKHLISLFHNSPSHHPTPLLILETDAGAMELAANG